MGLLPMDPTSVSAMQSVKCATSFTIQLLRSYDAAGNYLILHPRLEVVTP